MTDWKKANELIEEFIKELGPIGLGWKIIGVLDYSMDNIYSSQMGLGNNIIKLKITLSCLIKTEEFPAKELSNSLNQTFKQLKK